MVMVIVMVMAGVLPLCPGGTPAASPTQAQKCARTCIFTKVIVMVMVMVMAGELPLCPGGTPVASPTQMTSLYFNRHYNYEIYLYAPYFYRNLYKYTA